MNNHFNPALEKASKQDIDFVTKNSTVTCCNIQLLLFKIYISTITLDLSTETRFISFVIFYRYLCQYQIQYTRSSHTHTHTHTHSHGHHAANTSTGTSQSQTNGNGNGNGNDGDLGIDEKLSHPQKHLGKVAAATLFLACKISNENRRIRDVINVYHILQFNDLSTPASALTTTTSTTFMNPNQIQNQEFIVKCCRNPPPLDEKYWTFKEEIVKVEHHLLRVLNFNAYNAVVSPYRIVVSILEEIVTHVGDVDDNVGVDGNVNNNVNNNINDSNDKELAIVLFKAILNGAWRQINDALFSIDAMTLKNSDFACGALTLALDKEETTTNEQISSSIMLQNIHKCHWWEWVDVSLEEMNAAKVKLIEASKGLSQQFRKDDVNY
jgi:hypothetical protein